MLAAASYVSGFTNPLKYTAMTKSQMIQRVANVINKGGKCVIIAGTNSTEDIYRLVRVDDPKYGQCIEVAYFDETEDVDPFHDGECALLPTWLGASKIIDAVMALNDK